MKWHGNLLYVRDLEESLSFYTGVLALRLVARPSPHLAMVGLDNGLLYLHADSGESPAWMKDALDARYRGVGVICHIEVKSMGELKARLDAAGVPISHGPVEAHGQLQLYVYDPSGYNLVFVQPLNEA